MSVRLRASFLVRVPAPPSVPPAPSPRPVPRAWQAWLLRAPAYAYAPYFAPCAPSHRQRARWE
eukprot:4193473-Pleurochrysis_carterae.AAC.1